MCNLCVRASCCALISGCRVTSVLGVTCTDIKKKSQ